MYIRMYFYNAIPVLTYAHQVKHRSYVNRNGIQLVPQIQLFYNKPPPFNNPGSAPGEHPQDENDCDQKWFIKPQVRNVMQASSGRVRYTSSLLPRVSQMYITSCLLPVNNKYNYVSHPSELARGA